MRPSSESLDLARLPDWLAAHGFAATRVEPLAGDVSPRRYLRITTAAGTAIVAWYPPAARAGCAQFRSTTALLGERGVRVPRILLADGAAGVMVLEDVGRRTLYEHTELDWSAREGWLGVAIDSARRVRGLNRATVAALNPPLDPALLRRELEATTELVLAPRGLGPDQPLGRAIADFFDRLAAAVGREPLVPAHRDFMVRNLVPLEAGVLAVLDHQDLRLGPAAYDVASLLNDSWFPPPEVEERLLAGCEDLGFSREEYRMAAVQRGLKAAGTYAAFARRGSDRHLPILQPTLERALGHWRRLEAERELAERVAERLRESC